MLELVPFLLPSDDLLAAVDDSLRVMVPFDLRYLAAGFVDLALFEFFPALVHDSLSFFSGPHEIYFELFNDLFPGSADLDLQFIDNRRTALSSFITSLKKLAVLLLCLSKCSLEDSLTLSFKFGRSHSTKPVFDLILNLFKIFDFVSDISPSLTHIAISRGFGSKTISSAWFLVDMQFLVDSMCTCKQNSDSDK